MIQIRPVSDLRNKFPEIEDIVVREGQPVYLTKNGYGSMVVLSLEKYAELMDDIELKLDEADKEAALTDIRYTHDEVFSRVRSRTNVADKLKRFANNLRRIESMKNITGLLIKENREKLGFKQEYLCKGVCSVSYLSKIEKGNIVASDEIVKLLFSKLGIDFNNDEEFVKEGKKLFEEFDKSRYFGMPIDEENLEKIRDNEPGYLNSPLYIDYRLFELFHKVFEIKNTDILKFKEYMDNDQLYKAYLITGYINGDINLLEKAKRIKYTAEVMAQIAYIKFIEGKYYESIDIYLEALDLAYNEGCIKKQLDICTMLGHIYLDFNILTMQKYYDKALLLLKYLKDERDYYIYYHMGIAYTSIDFNKAEEYLLKSLEMEQSDDKDSLERLYQKLCFLYLRYDKRENATIYYEKAIEINILKSVNELIGIMIGDEDYIHSEEYLSKLIDIYNESMEHRKHSNTKFYGDFLIEAYKANRKYKDALLVTEYLYRNQD